MTIEHRKADILNQLFQRDLSEMVGNVAALQQRVAELEAELAALKPASPPADQ